MAGRNQRDLRGLDVGCGTGRLLAFLHDAWPGLRLSGLDLSVPYLSEARRLIERIEISLPQRSILQQRDRAETAVRTYADDRAAAFRQRGEFLDGLA